MWLGVQLCLCAFAASLLPAFARAEVIRPEAIRKFLVTTQVRHLTQDRHGFLWVATDRGLARFDGLDFHFVEGHPRLTQAIDTVIPGDRDDLWIGILQPATILHMDSDSTEQIAVLGEPPLVTMVHMVRGRDGILWVAATNGLHRVDPRTRETRLLQVGSPHSHEVTDVLEAEDGTIWVATNIGLGKVENDARIHIVGPHEWIGGLLRGSDGEIVLTRANAIYAFSNRTGQFRPLCEPATEATWPRPLLLEPDGSVLIREDNAIWRVAAGKRIPVTGLPGLETGLHAVLRDREGNLWFGTGTAGLVQKKARHPFKVLTAEDGLPNPIVFSIAPSHAGGVWTSGPGGLLHWPPGGQPPRSIPVRPHAWPAELRGLAEDPDGTLWVGTNNKGLLRVRNGVAENAIVALNLPAGGVRWITRDREGTLWLGFEDGNLIAERMGKRRFWKREELACPASVFSSCETPDGTLWIGTNYGGVCAIRRVGDDWVFTRYGYGDELPTERINAVACVDNGDLWVGTTTHGLARKRGDTWSGVGVTAGLRFPDVGQIIRDRTGYTWISSQRGIQRIANTELDAVADGKLAHVTSIAYDVDDGMGGNTVVRAFPPAGTLSPEGEVWFPTLGGAVVFTNPEAIEKPVTPQPLIESVVLDGRPQNNFASTLVADVGAGNLQIAYAAPTFDLPHRVRFRYQLVGFDSGWTQAGRRRTAYYTNLPPGQFTFVVEAMIEGQDEHRQATLTIDLVPPFHRTRSFLAILCGIAGLIIFGTVRLRLWQQRARFAAIADERNRIARDMHDTLEQSLVASRLQLDAAEAASAQPQIAARHIARARELVDRSMREAKSSIWALRAGLSDEADLRVALSATIGQALMGTTVAFHLEVDGEPYRLEPEAERQIVRIAQEAVTNALKHGAPSNIHMRLAFAPDGVTLDCRDNGRGFDTGGSVATASGKPGAHYGLRGMHERAQGLAGWVEIKSAVGVGTHVTAFVPSRWRRRSQMHRKNGTVQSTT